MPRVDSEHRGPLLNVAELITLVSMIVIATAKVATKWIMVRKLQNDDILMIMALLTAVGQCIAIFQETQAGLGQPRKNLTLHQFDQYQKAAYVSEIFYILPVYLGKIATMQFLITLARPSGPNVKRRTAKSVFGILSTWLVAAVVCLLFQCDIPYPWRVNPGHCFNQLVFWTVNGALDVVSQILIALAPVYLLYDLQLPAASKRLAMVSFTPNLTTIPLAVLRLVYLFKASNSSEPSRASYNAALTSVIHVNYSIIASCIPFLKPLIDALVVGLITNDIQVPIALDDSIPRKERFSPFAILGAKNLNARTVYGGSKSQSSGYTATATAAKDSDTELLDTEHYGSRDRMVINQTTTTVVASKPRKPEPLHHSVP